MTAAPKGPPLLKLHCREGFAGRTCHSGREADAPREETGNCTGETRRGMGPSTYARIVEITSGTTTLQQGLAATCKDSSYRQLAEIGERSLVGRMSQYERGRRGNAL
jgi:hypothetical protein